MMRLSMVAPLVVVLVTAQTAAVPAWAADPTPRDIKCQWKKHRKAGRYQACLQNAVVEEVKNPLFDLDAAKAACVAAFETAWELQDANAAALGEECLDGAGNFDGVRAMLDAPADRLEAWLAGTRWVNNGDGTATDSTTGLQWELKTDDGSVHDKDNEYTWNTQAVGLGVAATTPNGTAFTEFVGTLNGGVSADGSTTTECFAGHCDWRLPTIVELRGILDAEFPNCTITPCTKIPGPTGERPYWSSSTAPQVDPFQPQAWLVQFENGIFGSDSKGASGYHVRAVRGGS